LHITKIFSLLSLSPNYKVLGVVGKYTPQKYPNKSLCVYTTEPIKIRSFFGKNIQCSSSVDKRTSVSTSDVARISQKFFLAGSTPSRRKPLEV